MIRQQENNKKAQFSAGEGEGHKTANFEFKFCVIQF